MGAVQIFEMRLRKSDASKQVSPFERVMAESVLYHAAIVSFYVEFEDGVLSEFFDSLDYIYKSRPYRHASLWANSPVLGVGSKLYRIICTICQLCRRTPLRPRDQILTGALAEELRAAEIFEEQASSLQSNDTETFDCFNSSKLYVIAAKILLYKLQHPEIQESDHWIQSQVQDGMDILRVMPKVYECVQYICWPILVLGCALVDDSDIMLVRQKLKDMWDKSFCGDITRAALALEASWKVTRQTQLETTAQVTTVVESGLSLLLHRRSTLCI
jgi:hypothetical protein